jgi:hypothetical protein
MEPYDNRQPKVTPAMIPGIVLVGIGVLFLLDNLHIVHVSTWIAYWPVILIALGLVKLVDATTNAGRIGGGVLLAVGGLFLGDNLGYLRIDQMWPLILIAIGLFLMWQRLHPGYNYEQWWGGPFRWPRWDWKDRDWKDREWKGWDWKHGDWKHGEPQEGESKPWDRDRARQWAGDRWGFHASSSDSLNEVNVFSGTRRVITDQNFRRGKVACVFGGITLDMTGANIAEDKAVLELSAVYGGAVVRVPAHWNVVIRAGAFFGGYADQTVHPPAGPDTKRLIVKGGAVFGGVTIKN